MKTCRKGLHQFTGSQCHDCWTAGLRVRRHSRREAERLAHPERRYLTDEHRENIRAAKLNKVVGRKKPSPRNVFSNNLRKYKLTVQVFAMMWLRADGKCENPGCRRALDLDKKSWAIDHDPSCCPGAKTCGRCTRGLLCSQCNVGLGYLGDSESKALGLVEYLHLTSNHRRESGT